jgi:hypothetical protein
VRRLLENKPHSEMGYRAYLGILRLEKTYSRARLEAASQRSVQTADLFLSELQIHSQAFGRPAVPAFNVAQSEPGTKTFAGPERPGAEGLPRQAIGFASTNYRVVPELAVPRADGSGGRFVLRLSRTENVYNT